MDGKRITFYPNGKAQLEANYKAGRPDGKWKNYDDNGSVVYLTIFKLGKKIKEVDYIMPGKK
jgi:antitoxin component YwqK of YwqJK toxin-antitoxin module